MDLACSCASFLSAWIPGVASLTGFAFQSSSLLGGGICLWDAFSKEEEIPKGISEKKLLEAPWLGLRSRLDRVGRQILLIQRINIGDRDPTHAVPPGAVRGAIQMQVHSIPFDDGKRLVVIGGLKAQLPIEGQGLFQVLDDKTRSNREKRGGTAWC